MKSILIVALLAFGALTVNAADKTAAQIVQLSVTEKGFEPDKISVKPGTHVILKVTRKTDSTCATQIKISEKKIKKDLPLNKEVSVDVGTLEKGKIGFACGMDMISGFIVVE
jgi:plastocyanin domain-containing protein